MRFHRLFHAVLQELIQILVRQIMYSLVTHPPALPFNLLHRLPAGFIIIQKATDLSVTSKDIHCLGQVGHRIEHHTVRYGLPFFKARYER